MTAVDDIRSEEELQYYQLYKGGALAYDDKCMIENGYKRICQIYARRLKCGHYGPLMRERGHEDLGN